MSTKELFVFLDWLDRRRLWLFTLPQAALYFKEPPNTLKQSLSRHSKSGFLAHLCRGLYANLRSQNMPIYGREAIVPYLRPGCLTYISLESVLSDWGIISQIPRILTCMTNGRRGIFNMRIGTIEFVHFHRPNLDFLHTDLHWDDQRQIWYASPALAWRDLKKVGRNIGLVDQESLEESINEYTA